VELVALRRVAPRNSVATHVVHHERPLDAGELSQRDNFHQCAADASELLGKTSEKYFRFVDRNDLLATYNMYEDEFRTEHTFVPRSFVSPHHAKIHNASTA
jgi:hypothetical protein